MVGPPTETEVPGRIEAVQEKAEMMGKERRILGEAAGGLQHPANSKTESYVFLFLLFYVSYPEGRRMTLRRFFCASEHTLIIHERALTWSIILW